MGNRALTVDPAFSGNGEPTSYADFLAAVDCVARVMHEFALPDGALLRLIASGSFMHRPVARQAVAPIGSQQGEVWFKLDAATETGIAGTNGIRLPVDKVRESLLACAELAPTWIQTRYFELDGKEWSHADESACLELVFMVGKRQRACSFTVWHALQCNQKPAGFQMLRATDLFSLPIASPRLESGLLPTPDNQAFNTAKRPSS